MADGRRRSARTGMHPAVSEILSVIVIAVVLAVGTGVYLYAFHDRAQAGDEAVRGHLDLSRMRASELVAWSGARCVNSTMMEFLLHNYGGENLSTSDIRVFGSWGPYLHEFDGPAARYYTLSNADVTGLGVQGGETARVTVDTDCSSTTASGDPWLCGANPASPDNSFSCGTTRVSLVTPAEEVVHVRHGEYSPPFSANIPSAPDPVSCALAAPADRSQNATATVCFDMTKQPLPVTKIEVYSLGRGNTDPLASRLVAEASAGEFTAVDGNTCVTWSMGQGAVVTRYRFYNDEGHSLFEQRPWVRFATYDGDYLCHLRPYERPELNGANFCPNGGPMISAAEWAQGRRC